jgi:hypothetical protein
MKGAHVTKLITAAAAAMILFSAMSDQANAGHRHRLKVVVTHGGYIVGEPGARWGDMCWVPSAAFVNSFYYYGWWAPCDD